MPSVWIALSKKLLLELATLDLSEISLLFSNNDIFGKIVALYNKNVLTVLQIFLLSCHQSHLLNKAVHNIFYSLFCIIQYINSLVFYILVFHLPFFCIFVLEFRFFIIALVVAFCGSGNIVSSKLFSFQ